jgi:hypothetical protein
MTFEKYASNRCCDAAAAAAGDDDDGHSLLVSRGTNERSVSIPIDLPASWTDRRPADCLCAQGLSPFVSPDGVGSVCSRHSGWSHRDAAYQYSARAARVCPSFSRLTASVRPARDCCVVYFMDPPTTFRRESDGSSIQSIVALARQKPGQGTPSVIVARELSGGVDDECSAY